MGSQQFCLKWNNHQSNMLVVFDQLLQNEAFVDVTLACEGLSIKAHKMVLSACSPYFQHLFLENPCKHPIVILNSIRYCDLKAIVDFMYKGEVNVSQEQLSALLKTAEALKVKGLAEVTNQTAAKIPREILPSPNTPPQSQQTQRTTSPPPKRKKIRNGNSNSPTHHHKQLPHTDAQITTTPETVDDIPPPPPKVVLAMSELSQDGPSDQEGQRSSEESDHATQIKEHQTPVIIPQPVITTMTIPPTERITSSPEPTDDKSYLRHLTSETVCDGSETTNKETHLHHLPQTTTTLSSLLTSDTSHQPHNISMIPSTSGTQNSTHGFRSSRLETMLTSNETSEKSDVNSDLLANNNWSGQLSTTEHQLARVNVQRRCRVCYHVRGERHESIYMCLACKVHVCNPSRRNCYDIHHTILGSSRFSRNNKPFAPRKLK